MSEKAFVLKPPTSSSPVQKKAWNQVSGWRVLRATLSMIRHISEVGRRYGPVGRIRSFSDRAEGLHWIGKTVCSIHNIKVRVHGTLPGETSVLASNHLSYIDPLILTSVNGAIPIAKSEVASWPYLGPKVSIAGAEFVKRANPHHGAIVLRQVERMLSEGVSVINFPEGTTTDGNTLPFKRGIFGAAMHAKIPITPIRLVYDDSSLHWHGDAFFLPHFFRLAGRRQTFVDVLIGQPIMPKPGDTAESLAEQTWQSVHALKP